MANAAEDAVMRAHLSKTHDKLSLAATIYLYPFASGISIMSTYILVHSIAEVETVSRISILYVLQIWH